MAHPDGLVVALLHGTDEEQARSEAMARASRLLGCPVAAVSIPIGEAAIDVDRPEDLALAEAILARRTVSGENG